MQEPDISIYHGETLSNRIYTLFKATRPAFFTASILPILIGLALSWQLNGHLSLDLALLTLLSIVFIHAGANVLNDYFDASNGTDINNSARVFPFSGGSRFIQNDILSANEMLRFGIGLMGLGLLLGLWVWQLTGTLILAIGFIGGLLAIFYSSPPCLACKGLGDITIATCFGILPVTGTVWIQLHYIPTPAWWLGAIIGCFTAAILWINSIPDIAADRKAHKFTLPARLGKQKARYGLPIIFILGFILIAIAPLSNDRFIALLALIPALKASHSLLNAQLIPAIPLTLVTHLAVGLLLVVASLLG